MTLVIMAAGMGSRFGGLKQIEPMGPNGEFIIDYSIYDAKEAGFNKVIFIIKEENYEIFKETIGKRIEGVIDVEYVFQDMKYLPLGISFPIDREKPLGTAHAIYCIKDVVTEPFVIINSDDFYGKDAYVKAANFLKEKCEDYAMISYKVINTLTDVGSVKRGVCEHKNGYLTKLVESNVVKDNGEIICTPLNGGKKEIVKEDTIVSMNMFAFNLDIFKYLEKYFYEFYNDESIDKLKGEYLIPNVVSKLLINREKSIRVIKTDAVWQGITYKDDKDTFIKYLNGLISSGKYPNKLYNDQI